MDAKTWTSIATFDKAQDVFRVDLEGKSVKARYVRIERPASTDISKPPGRFHFRSFLVYGTKTPGTALPVSSLKVSPKVKG